MAAAKITDFRLSSSDSSESEGEFEYTEPMGNDHSTICTNVIKNCKEMPCGCERCSRKRGKTTYK